MSHLSQFGKTGIVDSGEIIGYIGRTGNSAGCHLHIESNKGRLVLSGKQVIPQYWYNGPEYISHGPIDIPNFRVYDFWRRADPIYASNQTGKYNFDAQFKIENKSNKPLVVDDMAIAILKNGKFLFDCWIKRSPTKIAQKSKYQTGIQYCEIYEPGRYTAEARLKIRGKWKAYESLPFTVNAPYSNPQAAEECNSQQRSTADRIFGYIERYYSFWFPPGSTTNEYLVDGINIYYRFYKSTQSYLLIWKDNHLWYRIRSSKWRQSGTIAEWCNAASRK